MYPPGADGSYLRRHSYGRLLLKPSPRGRCCHCYAVWCRMASVCATWRSEVVDPVTRECVVEVSVPPPPDDDGTEGGGGGGGGTVSQCMSTSPPAGGCRVRRSGVSGSTLPSVTCSRCSHRRRQTAHSGGAIIRTGPSISASEGRAGRLFLGPLGSTSVWLASPPTSGGPTMTPQQAAQIVVDSMDLRAADIGIVPEDEPGQVGYVGAPVWMWTAVGPERSARARHCFGGWDNDHGDRRRGADRVGHGRWRAGGVHGPGTRIRTRSGWPSRLIARHRYTRTSVGNRAAPTR